MSNVAPNGAALDDSADSLDTANPDTYVSEVDPVFALAWNEVMDPENAGKAGEGADEADSAGDGTAKPSSGTEGAPAEGADGAAPAGGTESKPGVPDAGTDGAADTSRPAAVPDLAFADVQPQLAEASTAIIERSTRSFEAQATSELQNEIGNKWTEALASHPRLLVGTEVPSLKVAGEFEQIRDSADAKDWQDAAAKLMKDEIQRRVDIKTEEVKPMLSIIQDSLQMFENNPDLMPNTKEFDKELADAVAEVGKGFELRVSDKLYGYQVNMQPLINRERARLEKERGASGVKNEQRQQQAAGQARTEQGQFTNPDAPQAGIPSKTADAGAAEDDWLSFWRGTGLTGMSI